MLSLAAYTLLRPLRLSQLRHQPQVYLARSKHTDDLVVVKWLLYSVPKIEQRLFFHEIAVLQHLSSCQNHTHTPTHWLPLIDTGHDFLLPFQPEQQQQKVHYMVVPYVATGSLYDVLTNQVDQLKDIKALFWQLLCAVESLHQCGWLHLDLKPSNILFNTKNKKPEVILIDLALAQSTSRPNTQSPLNKITQGTPKYMSPEQFLAQDLNHQTDYYALGLILYQLLTQQLPFCIRNEQGINSTQQWAIQHCQQPVPLLPVPLACFQSLIDGLLAKERQYRLQTMQQIKDLTHQAFLSFNG